MKKLLLLFDFCNKSIGKMIIIVYIGLFYPFSINAFPVIYGMEVIGGERGVVVSFDTDTAIDAKIYGKDKQMTVLFKKCIYGLPEYTYDKMANASPIIKITAHEINNKEVEITLYLKNEVVMPIKTIQKNNKWIALISREPVKTFTWKTPHASNKNSIEKTITKPVEKKGEPSILKNVRLLERGQICELAFEFDKEVSGTIQRKNNIITLYVDNSLNKIGKKELLLPEKAAFKKIYLFQEKIENKSTLKVVFAIDTFNIDSDFNVAFTQGEVLSFVVAKRENKKATLWTSGHGLTVDYHFYDVPSYNVDLKQISKRAQHDATIQLSRENIFPIKEKKKNKDDAVVSKKRGDNKKDTINLNKPQEMVKNQIQSDRRSEFATIIAQNVNVRSIPSTKGGIKRGLEQGDTVEVIEIQNKWMRIVKEEDTGFVYADLLQKTNASSVNYNDKLAIKDSLSKKDMSITKVSINNTLPLEPNSTINSAEGSDEMLVIKDLPTLRKNTIQYKGGGRDPFQPLDQDSISISVFPFVENLNLVGVLIDDSEKIALCVDTRSKNRPFILRESDPVFKGRVLKIYKDKIVFLLTEYGISRSFTLNLEKILPDQEVSKK